MVAVTVSRAATVDAYLQGLEAPSRAVAPGEWGVSVEAAGWPFDVGLRLDGGLLRAQGEVVGPDRIADHELLVRNRGLLLVRYAHTGAGAGWVHGELPAELIAAVWLDRLLGALVDAAIVVRHRAG